MINLTFARTHYYDFQIQYLVSPGFKGRTQFANIQWDSINGKRFDISDKSTGKQVSIVHGTLLGRFEKVLALLITNALKQAERTKTSPSLPVWVSPIMLRIVLSGEMYQKSSLLKKIEQSLKRNHIRYQLDISSENLGDKIKRCHNDWIPYILMIEGNAQSEPCMYVKGPSEKLFSRSTPQLLIMSLKKNIHNYPHLTSVFPINYHQNNFL